VRLLLDAHSFIWWDGASARLSAAAFSACKDAANQLFLSAASVWEMQIKVQAGKLTLSLPLSTIVGQQRASGVSILPIDAEHVLELANLPMAHKDPFDRLLIAQARIEGMTLVTRDPVFAQYPVATLW
jgi:PIN domain nuclease of toxin-antitoxin system